MLNKSKMRFKVNLSGQYFNIFIFFSVLVAGCLYLFLTFNSSYLTLPTAEEKLYSLVTIKNFLEHGPAHTGWLSNYSTRDDSLPNVYTHLIDFPSIFSFILIKIGFTMEMIRLIFISITFISFIFLFIFFNKKFGVVWGLASIGYLFSSYTLLFADHLHVPLSFLTVVLSLILSLNRHIDISRYYFLSSILLVFSAMFSWFVTVNILIFNLLLVLFDHFKNSQKILKYSCFYISLFILLIILKIGINSVYLGLNIALNEIILTIQNRIIGKPSVDELLTFFNNNGIVLWGYQDKDPFNFFEYLLNIFLKYSSGIFNIIFLIYIIFLTDKNKFLTIIKKYKNEIITLIIFLFSLNAWNIFFPAHAQGYLNPIIVPFYFMLLFGLLIITVKSNISLLSNYFSSLKIYYSYIIVLPIIFFIIFKNISIFNERSSIFYDKLPDKMFELLNESSIYTNFSGIFLGYYLPKSFIFARCTPQAILNKDPTQCFNTFENISRDIDSKNASNNPKFFVFSKQLISGGMAWTSHDDLIVYEKILDSAFGNPLIFNVDGIKFSIYKIF